jgi:hypothetical protein
MEENRMIAEFMGWKQSDFSEEYMVPPQGERWEWSAYMMHSIKYHTSWDWLMPVVQKILNRDDQTFPDSYTLWVSDSLMYADIERVYSAVVSFLKWYNENQIKNIER